MKLLKLRIFRLLSLSALLSLGAGSLTADEAPRGADPAAEPAAPAEEKLKAATVLTVRYEPLGGLLYTYDKKSWSQEWREGDKKKGSDSLVETGRDEWSIYLRDATRQIEIVIDLHRGEILHRGYSESSPKKQAWKTLSKEISATDVEATF